MVRLLLYLSVALSVAGCREVRKVDPMNKIGPVNKTAERQITHGPGGRILTNTRVWSPDGNWIAYDVRSDAAGEKFDGDRIEMVHVATGEIRVIYHAKEGARCGVATFHPVEPRVVFILGPENPTADWQYNAYHRQGVIVDVAKNPTLAENLDARDIVAPYTPGALRGGSHVHVWDGAGDWVSFTYEDHVLAGFAGENAEHEINLRNVGVSVPGQPVRIGRGHVRNHDGSHFSVLVTCTVANPRPGSDEIKRAFEEAWVGTNGYVSAKGMRQKHALAFQGHVVTATGQTIAEVFIVDLPEDVTVPGDGPLEGTATRRPLPPSGTVQRRLTYTPDRKFPGLQGPRHWLRSSPDGSRIAFLMKDDAGVVQLWTVSPEGGAPAQLTRNSWPVGSAFTWSPDGRRIAHVMDGSVCVTDTRDGATHRLTPPAEEMSAPRPEACVFSPDGSQIAYVRRVAGQGGTANQIFVVATAGRSMGT
jgi:dipeptidyl aminopeptidase/acylaminoacyl peptidase